MSEIDLPNYNCRRMLLNGDIEAIWLYTYTGVLAWMQQALDLRVVVYHARQPIPGAQLLADVAKFDPAAAKLDARDAFILGGEPGK